MKYFAFVISALILSISIHSCAPKDDDLGLSTGPNTFVANLEGSAWQATKKEAVLSNEYLTIYGEAGDGSLLTLQIKLYNYQPVGKTYVLTNASNHYASFDNTTRTDSLIYWTKNNYDAYGQSGDIELIKIDELNRVVSGTFKFRAFNNHLATDYLYLSQGSFTDVRIVDSLSINVNGIVWLPETNDNNNDGGL